MAWRDVWPVADRIASSLYPKLFCKTVSKDRRGRCNPVVVWNFIIQAVRRAFARGIEDPEHTIDWEASIDPELTRAENIAMLDTYFATLGGKEPSMEESEALAVSYIDQEIEYIESTLEEEEEKLTPEEREKLLRRIEELREERQRILGKAKEKGRRELPRRVREKRRLKPERAEEYARKHEEEVEALPELEAAEALPVEEARYRVETYVRSIVPQAYRFDWRDLKARISYHRGYEENLKKTVEEIGGRIEGIVEARPPLKIADVDFSKAKLPPMPLPPGMERLILWSKFSAILTALGGRAEDYRRDFEEILRTLEGKPFAEKQRRIEELARRLAPPPPPPPVIIPREIMERIEALEREVREARRIAAWRPSTPGEIRMMAEAMLLVEPRVALRIDRSGHPYYGPTDDVLQVLISILDKAALEYFTSCPECRFTLPGGGLKPTEFVEHLISPEGAVPPLFVEWLRRYARNVEEAERR